LDTPTKLALAFGLGILVGLLLVKSRRYYFQNRGEAKLARAVRSTFPPPDYYLLNHLTIPTPDGTTQIDHVLISRFGIFVIETKDYSGWIFGDAKARYWTQVLFNEKNRFQNPIRQNVGHVQTVRALLDFLPRESVSSAVVFVGSAEFKTDLPAGVYSIDGFLHFIAQQESEILSRNRVQFAIGRLETARAEVTRRTDIEHIEFVRRRFGKDD
jgi:restriction system protein